MSAGLIWTGLPAGREVPFLVWSGLVNGAVSGALGAAVVVGLRATRVLNLAVGSFFVVGALLYHSLASAGLADTVATGAVAATLCLAAGGVLGGVEEVALLRPLRRQPPSARLFATVGLALVIQGAALLVFGREPVAAPALVAGSLHVGTLLLTGPQVVLVVVALVLGFLTRWWQTRTETGLVAAAIADDEDAAMMLGIDVDRIRLGACVAMGAGCALMGALAVPITLVDANAGLLTSVGAFIAAVVGGGRSALRAVGAGLVVGVLSSFGARVLTNSIAQAATAAVLVALVAAGPAWQTLRGLDPG